MHNCKKNRIVCICLLLKMFLHWLNPRFNGFPSSQPQLSSLLLLMISHVVCGQCNAILNIYKVHVYVLFVEPYVKCFLKDNGLKSDNTPPWTFLLSKLYAYETNFQQFCQKRYIKLQNFRFLETPYKHHFLSKNFGSGS